MEFIPDPRNPAIARLVDDGSVPQSAIMYFDAARAGLDPSKPPTPFGSIGWFFFWYPLSAEASMIASLQAALSQQAQTAQLADFRAASVGLYDVVFSTEITAGSDLSLVSWQWNVGFDNGRGRLYPPEGIGASNVIPSPPITYAGGISAGSTWLQELRLVFTNPTDTAAEIICVGCTAGAITRTIAPVPRFGLRSQALDG